MTRLTFLPAPFVKIALGKRSDLGGYVIAGIHNERARVWRVNPDDTDGGELPFTGGQGKDDSVDVWIEGDGSVFVVVSEASGAGASGSTSLPDPQRIPSVFPPFVSASASGGYVSAPGGALRIFDAPVGYEGVATVPLPTVIPLNVSRIELKIAIAADASSRRARVGPDASTSGLVALTQAAHVWNYQFAGCAPGSGHTLTMNADAGALMTLRVDVLGWWL